MMKEVGSKTIWIIDSSFDDLSKYVDSSAKAMMREGSLQTTRMTDSTFDDLNRFKEIHKRWNFSDKKCVNLPFW